MKKINQPIFFIGVPKSGTTIIFEVFSINEELAWISNHLDLFPSIPFISFFARITSFVGLRGAKKQFDNQPWIKNVLPHPAESYKLWESCCGSKFLYDYMLKMTATNAEKRKIRKLISNVMFFQGKMRFAAKHTGPARIEYLNSLFPNAIFIHIVRDGRAVVNSLMNAGFWKERGGYNKPWWRNGLTEEDYNVYNKYKKLPIALAALQWRRIIKIAKEEAKKISKDRYYELKYEDFIKEPFVQIETLNNITSLKNSNKVYKYLKKHVKLSNQNFKYLKAFSNKEISVLNEIMCDTLSELKYNI